jgi:hypothetical protein
MPYWLLLAGALAAAQDPPPEDPRQLEEEIARELERDPSDPAPNPGATPPAGGKPSAPPTPGTAVAPAGGSGDPESPPGPQPGVAPLGGNPLARLLLLPDIGAVASAALAYNRLEVETLSPRSDPFAPPHTLEPLLQEVELSLQAVVDPYARADLFLSVGPHGADVEEAYLTTLRLPFALQARAGSFFAPFGRMNQQHGHSWSFVDRPLALARLLGPDALRGPGLDLAWLAPTPWFAELRVAYQAVTPGFATEAERGGVARLAQFFEVGEGATLGVGLSGARLGAAGDAWRDVYGADLYLKVRPLRARSYLALQAEVLARRLPVETGGGDTGAPLEPAGTLWGGHGQVVWRAGPFFEYGARYERAPALGLGTGAPEHRASALASWLPSEFQRLSLQVSYDRLPGGEDGLEALLGLEFVIGAHGAHPF